MLAGSLPQAGESTTKRLEVGRLLRYARIAWHVGVAVLKLGIFFPLWSPARRSAEKRQWARKALSIFGLRVSVTGSVSPNGETRLLVANHTSWLDVLAIMAATDAVFVAKKEVAAWPVFGWIARRLGTLFVERRAHHRLDNHVQDVGRSLSSGTSVAVFPEGTSSDGSSVLPFRTPFFEAAVVSGVAVQPIAISYRRAGGGQVPEVAFTGDMTLLQSFARLVSCENAYAEVGFLPPIQGAGFSRRELAALAQHVIEAKLFGG